MSAPEPFADDGEFLDVAFDWLTTRAKRLTLEREIRAAENDEAVVTGGRRSRRHAVEEEEDAAVRVATLQALEDHQRGVLQGRLAAHRAEPTARPLGFDRLVRDHDLGEDEQMVVLATLCGAISEERSNEMFGDLGVGFYGNLTVEGVSRLLDARTTAERLRVRRLLRVDGRLARSGVLVLDHLTQAPVHPDDFIGARLRLTEQAFAILTGDTPALKLLEGRR